MTIYYKQRYANDILIGTQLVPWWTALSVQSNASNEVVISAYKALCKQYHPDVGGTKEAMQYTTKRLINLKKERGL